MNISQLLEPINEQCAVGTDLRQVAYAQSLYYRVREMRNQARMIERQQIQGSESNEQPDWQVVYQLAIEALTNETKDLEIVTWLIEASLRLHGFAGLRDTFILARLMIEKYWDDIFPLADAEEGVAWRVAALAGLNGDEADGVLIAPIGLVPLIQGDHGECYALWHYQQALALFKVANKDKQAHRVAEGAVNFAMLEAAALAMPADALLAQRDCVLACMTAFKALNCVLDEKLGVDAPPSSRILAQLQACVDCINAVGQERLKAVEIIQQEAVVAEAVAVTTVQPDPSTRTAVVQSIRAAAKYFRETEPHSPISYLLERAVKWSHMALPDLLKELITNTQALNEFCQLSGVDVTDQQK